MPLVPRRDGDIHVHRLWKRDGLSVARGLQASKLMKRLVEAPPQPPLVARQDAHFLPARVVEGAARSRSWRREWDSNPRYGFPYTRFPSERLQPLGHPSGWPSFEGLHGALQAGSPD